MPVPPVPPTEALIHHLSQTLYRCFEETGTTKTALYLALDSPEGFFLTNHYGFPRYAPPPDFLAFDDPLLLWLHRERRTVLASHPDLPLELVRFTSGSPDARFMITPIYQAGAWVGLLVQRDRLKGAPFEPGRDVVVATDIANQLVHTLEEYHQPGVALPLSPAPPPPPEVMVVQVPAPVPTAPDPVEHLKRRTGTLETTLVPVEESRPQRRGTFLPEQRTFFWETARLMSAFVPMAAVALWSADPEELRPMLLYSQPPLSGDLRQQAMAHLTFQVADLEQTDLRVMSHVDAPDRPLLDGVFTTCQMVRLLGDEDGDTLLLFRLEDRPFGPQEQRLIQHLGRLLGHHLQEARVHERYHRAFLAMSHHLISSQDSHRDRIRPHSVATARLARLLGLRLNLGGPELEALSLAALLHDVGTLLMEPRLMRKPSLSPEEREHLRTHPLLAAKYLEGFEFPFDVKGIIRSHHERWDGAGYPDGLRGAAIPLASRIIHLVESYEVMATGRPYQDPKPLPVILAELQSESGRQFDPELVPVFLQLLREQAQEAGIGT